MYVLKLGWEWGMFLARNAIVCTFFGADGKREEIGKDFENLAWIMNVDGGFPEGGRMS